MQCISTLFRPNLTLLWTSLKCLNNTLHLIKRLLCNAEYMIQTNHLYKLGLYIGSTKHWSILQCMYTKWSSIHIGLIPHNKVAFIESDIIWLSVRDPLISHMTGTFIKLWCSIQFIMLTSSIQILLCPCHESASMSWVYVNAISFPICSLVELPP